MEKKPASKNGKKEKGRTGKKQEPTRCPSLLTTKYIVCSIFDLSISSASKDIKTPTTSAWGHPRVSAKPHVSAICCKQCS